MLASSSDRRKSAVRSNIQKDHPKLFGIRGITVEEKDILTRHADEEGENILSLVHDANEEALICYRNYNRVSIRNKPIRLDLSSMRRVFFTAPGNNSTVVIHAVRPIGRLSRTKDVIYTIQFEDWIEVIYFEDYIREHGPKQLLRFESPSPPTTAEEREAAALDLDWKPDSRDSNEELYIVHNARHTVAPGGPGSYQDGSSSPTNSPKAELSASVKLENATSIDLTEG